MNEELKMVLIFMAVMSVIGFGAMGIDKATAKANAWRIPEKTLFGIAFFGGGAGIWLGMEVFRHKTKHWYFKYGIPAITLLEFIVACYVLGS